MSNLFASKVREIVLALARADKCEFVASHQMPKNIISASTTYTETIETAKYFVFTAGIRYKVVYDVRLLKSNFLVLGRFVSPAAVPFALVVLWCYVRSYGQ